MFNIVISVIVFFIFWAICNYIVDFFLTLNLPDELIISAVKYRKTIMFNIFALIFFIIFNINFILWIGIIYYIIISILEGILTIIAIISNLDYYLKEKVFEKDSWSLVLAKTLNEIANIIMIVNLLALLN